MKSALHCHHAFAAQHPEYQSSGIKFQSGCLKIRDVRIHQFMLDFNILHESAKAGTENDPDLGLKAADPAFNVFGCFVNVLQHTVQ